MFKNIFNFKRRKFNIYTKMSKKLINFYKNSTKKNWSNNKNENLISVKATMTVLAVVLMHNFAHVKGIEYKCQHQDEFLYAAPGSRCTSYYKCTAAQIMQKMECPFGSMFDFYKQTCSRTPGICYEPVCTGRTDGIYPDTTHACRRSFSCQRGHLTSLDNCPYGELYNGQSCVAQDYVSCELPQATAIAYPFSGDRRCKGLKDGYHVADNTDCNHYINCRRGEVTEDNKCQSDYRYSELMHHCMPKNQVQSCNKNDLKLCTGLSNGFNKDPTSADCKSYIKCMNGKFLSREYCSSQAVFNGNTCVPAPLYQCESTVAALSADICMGKTSDFINDPRRGCGAYVRCSASKTIEEFDCPEGHYFDPDDKNCLIEQESMRKCVKSYPSKECSQLEIGYYQDKSLESSCQQYFYCYNGNRTDFQCDTGKLFDGENCVDESTYLCPNQNPNSCHSKPNGYFKDQHAGCRAYFYCSMGQKYRYLCAQNEIFDGVACVQRHTTEVACENMDLCIGKPDGYYYDLDSECRKYYFCLKQEVVTSLTCRGSKIFNGQKCVPQIEFTCPAADSGDGSGSEQFNVNCVPRKQCPQQCVKNGFYADIDSGCKNYHFCIADNKSVLSCSEGFLFNGEICVPKEQYVCPKYCT